MATAEQQKEAARRRQANKRARDKGMPEPYAVTDTAAEEAEKGVREQEHFSNLEWAQLQDATGHFYKSECRPAIKLLAIYEGNNYVGTEDPDEVDQKTGKKKQNIPNPWKTPIKIRAIELDGLKIDPDMRDHKTTYEVEGHVSFQQWLELRDKARKNLFWLARLLGLGFYHQTHQIMCDMFVRKNFDGLYYADFDRDAVHEMIEKQERHTADGTPTRTMLLFAPRSSYKSTTDGVDAVQWLLNCPDIRILIMTSVLRLSKELMTEIKRYFYLPPRGEATSFQLLFPEYILTGVSGRSKEAMTCPAQNFNSKEPHLWVTSLDASFVGSRCDIRKIDDAVEDKNSADDELRESLKEKIKATNALVEPWGFTDVIGTRYFTTDWYGWRMGQVPDGTEDIANSTEPFAYLSLSAWHPNPGYEVAYQLLLDTPGGVFEISEEMVSLFFPKKLSYRVLRTKLKEYKERGFKNQYLNIATDPNEVTDLTVHFTREVLRSHSYARTAAPISGEKIVTIDWAYSENKTSDYSVLACNLRHIREDNTEELIVTDLRYDKWKASDLASNIVLFLRDHQPNRTLIEKALGADLLNAVLIAYANKYGCPNVLNSIKWVPTENTANAKANRIKTLEILLNDDRLHFVNGPWMDELYKQFERFTGETKMGRKDDIPDAISMASRTLPPSMFTQVIHNPEEEQRIQEEQDKAVRKVAHYNQYFGNYMPTKSEAAPVIQEVAPPKPIDPRMKIFGNKGPWRL